MIWLPATRGDILEVFADLRASDREETAFTASALGRPHGYDLAAETVRLGGVEGLWHKGQILAVGGAHAMPETGMAAIWILARPGFDTHWRGTTRAARELTERSLRRFTTVGNVVPQHMTGRIRWLEHLGFDFPRAEANPIGRGLVPFWRHALARPDLGQAAS